MEKRTEKRRTAASDWKSGQSTTGLFPSASMPHMRGPFVRDAIIMQLVFIGCDDGANILRKSFKHSTQFLLLAC